jgi:AraC-like DNA-binding protein
MITSTLEPVGFVADAPGPPLDQLVSCFFSVSVRAGERQEVHTLPDGCVDLTIDVLLRRAFVTGLSTEPHTWRNVGPIELVGARFFPGAALPLLGAPVGELRDEWNPLEDFFANDLADRVADAPNRLARISILKQFLVEKIGGAAIDSRVRTATELLFRSAGTISLPVLGRTAGASPRNLGRLFHEWVGLSPKRVARIARFQKLLAEVRSQAIIDWSTLAFELGYFDQAHLIREVSALAGVTPTSLSDLSNRKRG